MDVCKLTNMDTPQENGRKHKIIVKELLLDYAKNSTLHGLRYVTEKGLTIFEKLFWMITFIASLILCSILIRNVYIKWKTSPVIVTVSERLVSVGEVPFPSVTICPQVKSDATVYNFSKDFEKMLIKETETIENLDKLLDLTMVCNLNDDFKVGHRLFTNESLIEHLDSVAPKLKDFIIYCSWRNETYDVAEEFFKKVYTADGVCYNMNGLAAEEMFRDTVQAKYKFSERDEQAKGWTLENGYSWTENNPFPLQGSENSGYPDLEIYIINKLNTSDGVCNGLKSGYKVYIQHPADHPQFSLYSYAIHDGQLTSLAISAEVVTTAPALKEIPPETRQCYFNDDRPLRYFKIYTASNCRAECESNYTLETCGCVGFYMPHDSESRICAEKKIECIEEAQNKMAKRELQIKVTGIGDGCKCLPACDSINYKADILTAEFHYAKYLKRLSKHFKNHYNVTPDTEFTKYSKLDVYFKNPEYVSMRRSELFGLTDFMANIGGLLGLFLGFSFLSIVELFYFLTVRPICALKGDSKVNIIKSPAVTEAVNEVSL